MDARAIVERAIQRTRKNALQQTAVGVGGAVLMTVMWGPRTFVIVMLAINALIAFFMVRRLVRLRANGPAVRALLDEPARVKEIAAWPRKPPAGQMPLMVDIRTTDGAMCSLLLEPKNALSVAADLGALQSRSPEAALLIPKIPVV